MATITGTDLDDVLEGRPLDDAMLGLSANDDLSRLSGDDSLYGGAGDDTIFGGDGSDLLSEGLGNDLIETDLGADVSVFGVAGDDRLEGESGADRIGLSLGDVAFGGSGSDRFLFDGQTLGTAGSGGVLIRDFDGVLANAANGEDKLVFATGLENGSFAYIGAAAFSAGGNSEARFAGSRLIEVDQNGGGAVDQAVLIDGVTAANLLTATDFLWLA